VALQNTDPFAAVPPLPHEKLRAAVTARRVRYLTLGYEPIPVISGRKRPALNNWRDTKLDIDMVRAWAEARPGELSTGIRTKYTPGFDIDIRDANVADQVQQALLKLLPGGTILTRIGQEPKRLIPTRCIKSFDKISVHYKSPDGEVHGIEVLADGQQFVAEGIHEDTHLPYHWGDNTDLLSIAHEHLPLVDKELAQRFITAASTIMEGIGWIKVDAKGKPKANGKGNSRGKIGKPGTNIIDDYHRFALKDEIAALAAAPKGTRNNALNTAAFNLFQLVAGGGLDENMVRERLFAAAEACGLVAEDGAASVHATIESGAKAGREQPRRAPEHNGDGHDRGRLHDDDHGDGGDRDHGRAHDEDEDLFTTKAGGLKMSGVDWLWPGRFALGKFGLIAGMPDMGKGQIAAFLAAAVTASVDLPCDEGSAAQGKVLWFNAEDGACDTIVPRLVAAGADPDRVHLVDGVRISGENRTFPFSLVTDLHLLKKKIRQIGNVTLVIIDPISAYLGVGKVDSRSATDVRGTLTPLKNMAEELHVAVIGIAHFNKKEEVKSALLRVSDSIAYVAQARHVYAVLDDPEDKDSKLFIKAKNNLARDAKALRYGMGVKKVGYDAKLGVDINAPFIIWHPQHVEITANEAMQAACGHTAKREAREFLLERLEVGPMKAEDVIEEAKLDGIAKRTLDRAKKELGVKSRKTPSKFGGEWYWELPAKAKPCS
jgi:putative DNA primase/helicase